jgi:hypothetical protein
MNPLNDFQKLQIKTCSSSKKSMLGVTLKLDLNEDVEGVLKSIENNTSQSQNNISGNENNMIGNIIGNISQNISGNIIGNENNASGNISGNASGNSTNPIIDDETTPISIIGLSLKRQESSVSVCVLCHVSFISQLLSLSLSYNHSLILSPILLGLPQELV